MSATVPLAPLVTTLLPADAVHRDPTTGKMSVLGVVNEIRAASFPTTCPFLAAYLAITDGHGPVSLRVRLVDTTEAQAEIAGGTLAFTLPHPLTVAEVALAMPEVTFPQAGEYRLQVVHNGEVLADHRILARPVAVPHGVP